MRYAWVTAAALVLMGVGTAGASKKCGDSWIADNKVCRIGTGTPYVPPAPTAAPVYTPALSRFGSCQDARAAGWANIPRTSRDYSSALDRDQDGIACEAGGDDDGPSPRSAQTTSTLPTSATAASCPAPTSNVPLTGQRAQARPVRVYDVEGQPYVSVAAFACANGFTLRENSGALTVMSPQHMLTVVGKAGMLDGRSFELTARLLPLNGEVTAFYPDLLNAFSLTVEGQNIQRIPAVPASGQRP